MAEWKHNPKIGWGEVWECSNCGERTTSTVMGYPRYNYCPMCGAKMNADRKTENNSEKPNNCEDLQDWKDRMWAEAIVTEPQPTTDCRQTDCYMCKWLGEVDVCGRCRNRNLFAEADTEPKPKDEPQTEEHCETCRHKDECEGATYEYKNTEWWCLGYAPIEDEPQTEVTTDCRQTDCPWK